jgi:hypothetical protein
MQLEARGLLAQRTAPGFRSAMLDFIVNPENMRPAEYQQKIEANISISIQFVIQLNQTLGRQQRSYLLNRIESLAADFEKLSCDPKEVPKVPRSRFKGLEVRE